MIDTAVNTKRRLSPEVRKGILGLGLGNTLEWFDWMIFGLLAVYLGPHFFPNEDPVASTLNALAVFAVGFFFRPLGGAILGTVADRIGRKKVMILAISMMALATLVIAICPTYEQIGAWAGIILLVCRAVQGISTGVEAPLSTAHAVEILPEGREGTAAGIMSFFVMLGLLLAPLSTFLVTIALPADAMNSWGWRIPFFFGAALGVIVLFLRRTLPETMSTEMLNEATTGSIWIGVRKSWLSVVAIVFVVGAVQAYNYAWNVGLPNAARVMGEDPSAVYAITTVLALILMVGALIVGKLVDGRSLSRWFLVTRLLAIPSVFLMLLYTEPGLGGFAAVVLGGAIVLTLNMTLYNVVSTSLMQKRFRGAGTALGYGLGVAIFGGTASYLMLWLQSIGLAWTFPVYVAGLLLLSVVFYLLARYRNGIFVGK